VNQLPSTHWSHLHNKYSLLYLDWNRLSTIKHFLENRTAQSTRTLCKSVTTLQFSNEITVNIKITNKTTTRVITTTYLLYPTMFLFMLTMLWIKKYRSADTDHTSCNWSSIVDISALIFGWSHTTVPTVLAKLWPRSTSKIDWLTELRFYIPLDTKYGIESTSKTISSLNVFFFKIHSTDTHTDRGTYTHTHLTDCSTWTTELPNWTSKIY